jgi:hypothetical protein
MNTVFKEIIIGFVSFGLGILANLFFITPRWRNKINKEISLSLKQDLIQTNAKGIQSMFLNYDLSCYDDETQTIKSAYWLLPKKISGVQMRNEFGSFTLPVYGKETVLLPKEFKRSLKNTLQLSNHLIDKINEGKLKKISFVIETNKYGLIKSNTINLKQFVKNVKKHQENVNKIFSTN